MTPLVTSASYIDTGVSRFRGNPFIEALPALESSKNEFLLNISHYPLKPTAATRKQGEIVRSMELATLNDLVYPFPEYQKAAMAIATIWRESYVARNPLDVIDRQRRYALSTGGAVPLPPNWKSSGKGHLVVAISGAGKTTLVLRYLLRYPQVIAHDGYNGNHLKCHQVTYLVLRVPHDATLKGLCLQFFQKIDALLSTSYLRQAINLRNIAPMVQLMNQVATAVSLGLLVIDEVQNLKNATGENAEVVLNLFSEIIEHLGISLVSVATPAVQLVASGSVGNIRKIASHGITNLNPMDRDDPGWNEFCNSYWDYTYVQHKGKLTKNIMNAWHDVSAGNTAFAALAFSLAQRNEIGGREIIDEIAFQRVAAVDMSFLQPAIGALLSKDPVKLAAFDDLLFLPQYLALRQAQGIQIPAAEPSTAEEFEEMAPAAPKKPKARGKKSAVPSEPVDLGAMENPLGW